MFNFLKSSKSTPAKKAKEIIDHVGEEIIHAIWDAYKHIKEEYPEQYDDFNEPLFQKMKDSWLGINKVVEYKGDFSKFDNSEQNLLLALKDGHLAYSDVLHVLIDHHDDKKESSFIFDKRPNLHKNLPKEYDHEEQVLEVLIELTKDYQWDLEHFYLDFYEKIEKALGNQNVDGEIYVTSD